MKIYCLFCIRSRLYGIKGVAQGMVYCIIGTVDSWEDGVAHCTQRSKFCLGDSLEILQPDGSVVPVTPEWIKNAEGEAVDATPHPMMQYTIPTNPQCR